MELDPLAGEEAAEDLEALGETVDAPVERKPESPELELVPAGADTEHQPATRDLVDGGGLLGQQGRVVEREGGDEGADLDPLGDRRDRRQHRPRLPGADPGTVDLVQEVLTHPDGIEAGRFDQRRHLGELGPAHRTLHLRELDTDLHGSRGHGGRV